jgi:hypothetical protein
MTETPSKIPLDDIEPRIADIAVDGRQDFGDDPALEEQRNEKSRQRV